jgi:Zn-dependent peptidase ImmA (M78 family)
VPQSTRAHLTPAALQWARELVGFDVAEAAARVGVREERLREAERGEWQLTLRQAEAAARLYEQPLAALFLPTPPSVEPLEAQFRRLPGAPPLPWPREMKALARRIRDRQEAASELYDLLDELPVWTELDLGFEEQPDVLAAHVRARLGIDLNDQKSWCDRSGYQPLRAWVDAIESLGVLVMQDGSLPLDTMRGFASTHPLVPAIVVNPRDDPRARAFTALHELAHLLRANEGRNPQADAETWCNEFASAVLMPEASFSRDYERRSEAGLVARIDAVALEYGVTPHASAVRIARLELTPQRDVDEAIEAIRARALVLEPREGGGDYYRTTVTRLGPAFIRLVMGAVDGQAVTYPAASGILGVKVNNFGKLRATVAERRR